MTCVDFVMRSNTWDKPGGDLHQVQEYIRYLTDHGVDSRIVEFRPGLTFRDGAIVHIVNVDRPFDFLESVRAAQGHEIFVSPIHHGLGAVREMRKAEVGQGLRSLVGRLLPEWGREWLAYVVRSVLQAKSSIAIVRAIPAYVSYIPSMPFVWRRVGKALDRAACVLLLAKGEGRDLEVDTGWKGQNSRLLPNGAPAIDGSGTDWSDRSERILVAGRIEPRKRQLEIARAAAQLGMKVDFVGPTSSTTDKYGSEFRDFVASAPGITWLGALDHSDLVAEMSRRKVLLNASWVEVQSLVDLEAAFSGCYVVARSAGNSAEWLPDSVSSCETSSVGELLREASHRSKLPSGPPRPRYDWTWPRCAEELTNAYRERRTSPLESTRREGSQ